MAATTYIALRKICQNTGFLWAVFFCKVQDLWSIILSLYEKIKIRENLFSDIFYVVWVYTSFYLPINLKLCTEVAQRQMCPYSELFWSAFSRIWTEYGEIRSISPYPVWKRENAVQNTSEHGHFLRKVDSPETAEIVPFYKISTPGN